MPEDIVKRLERILLGAEERELDATEIRAMRDAIYTIKMLREEIDEFYEDSLAREE